ncbi:MAG TPA: uroporphyrinogen-III C-methyltransferase [Puia sp.]
MNLAPPISTELILIGAGPGDPELITVKAWKALQRADVILYDNLTNAALLESARPGCECIFVGKRPYRATITQEEIHELIRRKAISGGTIIRLKGGDPFIFGRGFEELLFARRLGLRVSYIPGITSMQTAGLADIPLTHRAMSESIWIVTGTKKDGSLSADLRLALQSKATVVIYMGMKKLGEIAGLYRQEGFAAMPAAIIRNGSWAHQQVAVGTAGELVELAATHGLTHPAIIVIGEVVGLGAAGEQKSHRTLPLFMEPPAAIV